MAPRSLSVTRERLLMPEQFEKLAAKVHDRPFRDFLLTLRHTGCRPIEARTVEAVHFHPAERCWLMPNIGHGEVDEDASQMRRVPLYAVNRRQEGCEYKS